MNFLQDDSLLQQRLRELEEARQREEQKLERALAAYLERKAASPFSRRVSVSRIAEEFQVSASLLRNRLEKLKESS